MYTAFYGLVEPPFNLTPDSKYLFLSQRHQEALSALLFGVQERKGFICLSGEIGSGKTTLIRALLGRLDREHTRTAMILNSYLDDLELLKSINEEFGLNAESDSRKTLLDELNRFLVQQFEAGNNVLLILDEAQNLRPETLEQIRMISNLETETDKLIQILLVGQPELRRTLALPELEQLNQRITVRYHVTPLDEAEIGLYIHHRMVVARSQVTVQFAPQALRLVYHHTKGVPRKINVLIDRCLLLGYVMGRYDIDGEMVQQAIDEVSGEAGGAAPSSRAAVATPASSRAWMSWAGQAALGIAVVGIVVGGIWAGSALRRMTKEGSPGFVSPILASTGSSEPGAVEQSSAQTFANDAGAPGGVQNAERIQSSEAARVEIASLAANAQAASAEPARPIEGEQLAAEVAEFSTANVKAGQAESEFANEPDDSKPAEAPVIAAPPAKKPNPKLFPQAWSLDRDSIVRVHRADHADAAAYLTLLKRWGLQISLKEFAEAEGDLIARYDMETMVRQLEFRTITTADLTLALRLDLPMLIRLDPDELGDGDLAPTLALIEMRGDLLTVADPISGLRQIRRSEIEPMIGEICVLYRDSDSLSDLVPGDTGAGVETLQLALAEVGQDVGNVDGQFGPKLSDAIRNFQKQRNLPRTGRVTPMTAALLSVALQISRPRLYS